MGLNVTTSAAIVCSVNSGHAGVMFTTATVATEVGHGSNTDDGVHGDGGAWWTNEEEADPMGTVLLVVRCWVAVVVGFIYYEGVLSTRLAGDQVATTRQPHGDHW